MTAAFDDLGVPNLVCPPLVHGVLYKIVNCTTTTNELGHGTALDAKHILRQPKQCSTNEQLNTSKCPI